MFNRRQFLGALGRPAGAALALAVLDPFKITDVLAALEVKELGSWGEQTLNQIRRNFGLIRQIRDDIYCAYITLTERKGFKQAITKENLGFPAYTLFWHKGDDIENGEPTGDFGRLLNDLRKIAP